jgi:hypothetical protein
MTTGPFRPVLRTQADVASFWTRICHPLGWTRHDLWFVIVDADGRPLPVVQDVQGLSVEVEPDVVESLVEVWRRVRDDLVPGGSIAVLLCRPGAAVVQPSDREWTAALVTAASDADVPLEVVHVASDDAIVPLPLDAVA